jgi:hypothetical protein
MTIIMGSLGLIAVPATLRRVGKGQLSTILLPLSNSLENIVGWLAKLATTAEPSRGLRKIVTHAMQKMTITEGSLEPIAGSVIPLKAGRALLLIILGPLSN